MKIEIFVGREIQYFEIEIFSFNSDVYYSKRGSLAPTRAFNLLTRAFNLPTGAFNLPTCAFNLATRAFSLLTRGFELLTRGFELVTRVLLYHVQILFIFCMLKKNKYILLMFQNITQIVKNKLLFE